MFDWFRRATVDDVATLQRPPFEGVAFLYTSLLERFRKRVDAGPIATAAAGRLAGGSLLLAHVASLETHLLVKGKGPLGSAWARVRKNEILDMGAKNLQVDLPVRAGKLDVAGALGAGSLTARVGSKNATVRLRGGGIAGEVADLLVSYGHTQNVVLISELLKRSGVAGAGAVLVSAVRPLTDPEITTMERSIARAAPLSAQLGSGSTPLRWLQELLPHF